MFIPKQNVVCSHLFLTWHEPVVSQSGQCFDWPVSGKVGLGPPPRHFLVEVKFLLTFIALCSKSLSPDTCVYELWTFMALKHFGGASWKGLKNEYLCVINVQIIQRFYNRRLLSPSASAFIRCQNNRMVRFTYSLTFLYKHCYTVGFVVYLNWRHWTESVYYL